MKTKPALFFLVLPIIPILLWMSSISFVRTSGQLNLSLDSFATGFFNVVDVTHAGDSRIFVVEQPGRIQVVDSGGTRLEQHFLDINDKVLFGGERGLLGLAFHPDYAANGYFYVNYTRDAGGPGNGDTVVARYEVSANPNIADPGSEVVLLIIDQPDSQSNHNGGGLAFGPDGFLYIGMGDGGSFGDPWENSQSMDTLLGKMLRIDVDSGPGAAPDSCSLSGSGYSVPTGAGGNPFADGPGGDCDEIWALGLRNPWRYSFDRLTGDLWIGDVGQSAWEEIDFQPAASNGGENWGWDCYEGSSLYADPSPGLPCGPPGSYEMPAFEYSHGSGRCSVTGGFVYRGGLYPDFFGHYVAADFCSGDFWTLFPDGQGGFTATAHGSKGGGFTTFGEDLSGELYIANASTVFHIEEDSPGPTPTPSATPNFILDIYLPLTVRE